MSTVKDPVVSLRHEMYDVSNQLLDRTKEPITYLCGGYDGIFPLVEEALHSKNVGDTAEVALSPDDASDEQDPELVCIKGVSVLPIKVEAGMTSGADDPETGDILIYHVTDVADGRAAVDDSHLLAGMKVLFRTTVKGACDTAEEEIIHGHIRGPYGHHHH